MDTTTNSTPETPKPDLNLLTDSREWRRLTSQQKVFVLDFLTTGDARHATDAAFPKAAVASRRSLQYQVLRAPGVVDALEYWKFLTPRTALIEIVRQNLKAAEPGSTSASKFAIQLERLLLHVPGSNGAHFKDPDAPPKPETPTAVEASTEPTFFIGQRLEERDSEGQVHVGIVRSLTPDGKPDSIEEIICR
jgi:hypothetical protein